MFPTMKKLYIITAIVLLHCVGCTDDVLNLTNKNQLSEEGFWQTESDAELGLMGAYSALQSNYLFDSYPWNGGAIRFDYMSDNGYTVWQWVPWATLPRGEFTSTSSGNDDFFRAAYTAINRANQVIARVPEVKEMELTAINRMVAEAKVIRSTAYLLLAMTYGDVPLIKETKTVEESDIPKTSKDEIFSFIFQDLTEAATSLPKSVPATEWGRITQGAALGTLARAYLFHGAWQQAADAAKQVIDLNVYSLFPDYANLFSVQNEINDEVIFPVTFERGIGGEGSSFAWYRGNRFVDSQIPLPSLANAYYTTDGLPIQESSLYNPDHASENRDPRFKATIVANGDTWKGKPVKDEPAYYMRKWTEEDNDLDHTDSGQDWYILRYAHVLLIRAEALAQLGGYEAEVISLINQIRERAGMPHVEAVEGANLSQQALLEVVKHERRVETAFEGLRYFDLIRWREIAAAYEEYNNNSYGSYGPNQRKRKWEEKYYKWPLPQAEVDANEEIEQNPDY